MRHLKKLSQEEMAHKLHLSVNGYADIERGKTDVQMSRLEEIAKAMEVDIYELFNFGEKNVIFLTLENSPCSSTYIGQNINCTLKETDFETQRLQMLLNHKNELLEQQSKEIEALKEINALLKKNNPL